MEYYLNGFATVQCAVMLDQPHVHVERYYDNERFDGQNINKQIPLPEVYDPAFVEKIVNVCTLLQKGVKGDESLFGGIDDLEEVNGTTSDDGKCVNAVGAPGSIARMKVEFPNTIKQFVAQLTSQFGQPTDDPSLKSQVVAAALQLANDKLGGKKAGISVSSLADATVEAYLGTSLNENGSFIEDPIDPMDTYCVEYVSERSGEKPFTLGNSERKFQYVNGKYPNGKVDIAVYAFAGDLCYGYKAFRKMMNLDEAFDPQSMGPRPEAANGQTVTNPYEVQNNKMRQMEETSDDSGERDMLISQISDDYKSLNGIRPRRDMSGYSIEQLRLMADELSHQISSDIEREKSDDIAHQAATQKAMTKKPWSVGDVLGMTEDDRS